MDLIQKRNRYGVFHGSSSHREQLKLDYYWEESKKRRITNNNVVPLLFRIPHINASVISILEEPDL